MTSPATRASASERQGVAPDLHTFVLFLGHPRSGTTLLSSLLDAHSQIAIAFQHDALGLLASGIGRDRLIRELVESSRVHAEMDVLPSGYGYRVPGQWQGRYSVLRVVGDKKAAAVSEQLDRDPALLDRLRDEVGVPLRIIQVVRNPFDAIATNTLKNRSLRGRPGAGVDQYFRLADAAGRVRARLDESEILIVRHEALVADVRATLASVCDRLGVSPPADYLDACAELVFESPRRTRDALDWSTGLRKRVEDRIASDPLLAGYAFDG